MELIDLHVDLVYQHALQLLDGLIKLDRQITYTFFCGNKLLQEKTFGLDYN